MEQMTAAELLERTIKVLDSPERWTQGSAARDQKDIPVDVNDLSARSYCLLGAMCKASGIGNPIFFYGTHPSTQARKLIEEVAEASSIIRFNDDPQTTYEDVILTLKHAYHAALSLGV